MQRRKAKIVKRLRWAARPFKSGRPSRCRATAGCSPAINRVEFVAADGARQELDCKARGAPTGSVPMELKSVPSGRQRRRFGGARSTSTRAKARRDRRRGHRLELGMRVHRLGARWSCSRRWSSSVDGRPAGREGTLKHFKKQGLDIRLGAKVSGAKQGKTASRLSTPMHPNATVTVDKVSSPSPPVRSRTACSARARRRARRARLHQGGPRVPAPALRTSGRWRRGARPMLRQGKERADGRRPDRGPLVEVNYRRSFGDLHRTRDRLVGLTEEEVKKTGSRVQGPAASRSWRAACAQR